MDRRHCFGHVRLGQQTLRNLLRRCHELLEIARGGAVLFPRRVKAILQEGLEIRDRRELWLNNERFFVKGQGSAEVTATGARSRASASGTTSAITRAPCDPPVTRRRSRAPIKSG